MSDQEKPKRDKRCSLCNYFHESPFCPDINAKREKKWDEWDLNYQRAKLEFEAIKKREGK